MIDGVRETPIKCLARVFLVVTVMAASQFRGLSAAGLESQQAVGPRTWGLAGIRERMAIDGLPRSTLE